VLTAVAADLECLGGQLLGLIGVPGHQRSLGLRDNLRQLKVGWSSWSASDPAISWQRPISSMSPERWAAHRRGIAAQKSRTGPVAHRLREYVEKRLTEESADSGNVRQQRIYFCSPTLQVWRITTA
jgi:hypothetical protein